MSGSSVAGISPAIYNVGAVVLAAVRDTGTPEASGSATLDDTWYTDGEKEEPIFSPSPGLIMSVWNDKAPFVAAPDSPKSVDTGGTLVDAVVFVVVPGSSTVLEDISGPVRKKGDVVPRTFIVAV